jgi:tetratricopeptide (TPR) repeat protein
VKPTTGTTAFKPTTTGGVATRSGVIPPPVNFNGDGTVTLANGSTVSTQVFAAFAASQQDPEGWFWKTMGWYPHYHAPFGYGPFWFNPFGYGYGFGYGLGYGYGGYGYGGGLSFAYSSGNWAIGASFGWPAFGYQSAPAYVPVYTPPPTVIVQSPAVIESIPSVVPGQVETLPPPVVESAKPQPAEANFAVQGMEYFQAGKYQDAVKALRHAVVDDPRNGNLLALTGQALFASGSHNEAAGALQQSLATTPESEWVGASAKMARLAPAEASESLRKAIEKDPNVPALRFVAAYQAFGQGEYKQAQTHLDALLKVAPDDPVAKKLQAQTRKLAEGK